VFIRCCGKFPQFHAKESLGSKVKHKRTVYTNNNNNENNNTTNNNSIRFFNYLHAELNSQWPIIESARSIKQTIYKTKNIKRQKKND
jgi:hypothetical protein